MSKRAAIIGAGIGGLAAANLLARMGYDVSVYEQHTTPGGRAGRLDAAGFMFDTGPSWYLMPEVFEHYFALCGVRPSDYYTLQKLDPAYKVFFDYRKPMVISGDLQTDAQLFDSIESGAGARLRQYIQSAERVYNASLQRYLYNPKPLIRTALDARVLQDLPMLSKFLTQSLHAKVSGTVKTLPLQQILEYPSVFLGVSPFNAPSLYHLMSYIDFKQGVYYPMGGIYSVIEALTTIGSDLDVSYHYGAPVEKIATHNGHATGVQVAGELHPADVVVAAGDLHTVETRLLAQADQTYPESYWGGKVAAPSGLLVYLGVRGALPTLAHHNLLFVQKWRQNFERIFTKKQWPEQASLYVSRTSATDPSVAPKGHENLFMFVPVPAGVSQPADLTAAADHYIQQFAAESGITDLSSRIVYKSVRSTQYFTDAFQSWNGSALGMAHVLKQSAFWRPGTRSKKIDNLLYAGAGVQPGIGLPMCLISAELVAKQLLGDSTLGPLKDIHA